MPMKKSEIEFLGRLAKGITSQFGRNCEVVVHDLTSKDPDSTIVVIENGHVSGRKVGDGPSYVAFEAMNAKPEDVQDRLSYLTKTDDGRVLKSSTIYLRDSKGKPYGVFAINSDNTLFMAMRDVLADITALTVKQPESDAKRIPHNVADLLDELIEESVQYVGKPVALMTKEDKVKAIGFLNDAGAFLVTKSGQKVCTYFGISKFTLYSYMDEAKSKAAE